VKLWAIADLHVGFKENREGLEALGSYPDDWLIVAGDAGDTPAQIDLALRTLTPRFQQVIWVPGNHDLWTPRTLAAERRGVGHYERLVALCRRHGVLTPEDPYPVWPGDGPLRAIVQLFLLYDYSFAPDEVTADMAVQWAREANLRSADEDLLSPAPFDTRAAWCHARVAEAQARLEALPGDARLVLVNHFRSGATSRCSPHPPSPSARDAADRGLASGSTSRPSRTATCTCGRRDWWTRCGSRRCRWVTRASGTTGAGWGLT
jgi:hypothetical protein